MVDVQTTLSLKTYYPTKKSPTKKKRWGDFPGLPNLGGFFYSLRLANVDGHVEELFRLVDDDSDGHLTAEEFVEAMALPSVEQYLGYLEIHGKESSDFWGLQKKIMGTFMGPKKKVIMMEEYEISH